MTKLASDSDVSMQTLSLLCQPVSPRNCVARAVGSVGHTAVWWVDAALIRHMAPFAPDTMEVLWAQGEIVLPTPLLPSRS